MTIAITVVVPDGIVMVGEGRSITGSSKDFEEGYMQLQEGNYEIYTDNEEKIHLINNNIGLAYSGPSFDSNGWFVNTEIQKLNLLARKGYDISMLADEYKNNVADALPVGMKFAFHMAAYDDFLPLLITYPQKGNIPGFQNGRVTYGMCLDGETSIIRKLIKGEYIPFSRMSLRDAIEFAELTITVGYKYLQYFEGYKAVSGGPVDILVLTPNENKFLKHKTLSLLENR